jgi:hypothetical protein
VGQVGSPDNSVTVTDSCLGTTTNATIVPPYSDSGGYWVSPIGDSQWDSVDAGSHGCNATYQATFTLPADAISPSLSVTELADNSTNVSLNGNQPFITGNVPGQCVRAYDGPPVSGTTTSGLVPGLNTLTFNVDNCYPAAGQNPTGLDFVATITYSTGGGPPPPPPPPPPPGSPLPPSSPPPAGTAPGNDAGAGAPVPTCANHSVVLGPITVLASCFTVQGDSLVSTGRIRAGGVDIALNGAGTLVINRSALTITASAPVTVRLGSITVYKGSFTWHVQAHLGLSSVTGLKIKGLPVKGTLDFQATGGGVDVIATAAIGNTKFTGEVTLHLTNALGLELKHLNLALGQMPIRALTLKQASLEYRRTDASDVWTGQATVELPAKLPILVGTLEVTNGALSDIGLSASGIDKPIGTIVFLQELGVDVRFIPHLAFKGTIGLSAGPKVAGDRAIGLDGTLNADFGQPVVLEASGEMRVVDKVQVASADAKWTVPNQFTLAAYVQFGFGPVSASGSLKGGVAGDGFGVLGSGLVSVPGVSGHGLLYLSEKGITGCAGVQAGPAGIYGGFGLFWTGKLELWVEDCGMLDFNSAGHFSSARAAANTAPVTIMVPAGQRQTLFGARGRSDYPRYTLRSPTGQTIDPAAGIQGPIDGGGYRWVTDPTTHGSYVIVARPHPGTWTLTPGADSPPIASIGSALSAPDPTVRTRVRRTRRGYVLAWKARRIPGQRLRFVETGGNAYRTIATTAMTAGKRRFRPTDTGIGGRRRIEIQVSQNGLPRAEFHGARFSVPTPKPPARPRKARLRLRRTHAILTWSRSSRASKYEIVAEVNDGRRVYFQRPAQRRKITIPRAYKPISIAATIQPIAADGVKGQSKRTRARFKTTHHRH